MIKDFLKYYLRNGLLFKKYLKVQEKTEKFSPLELKEYQSEKLRKTIKVAYEYVPFYRKVFKERKLTPEDIRTAEDLVKLPIIDKHIIRENFKDFRNKAFKGLVFKGYTSGTTGAPGIFLRDLNSINFENASIWRQYKWAGREFKSRRVTLRGEVVCSSKKHEPPFWRYNMFSKELIMSSYHLSDENMTYYVEKIKGFNPYDLYAYPSTAYLLADFCKRYSIDLKFSCVFTSSEMLLEYQKDEIENTFGCKVYDWYGSAERVAAIGHCEHGAYHEISDYSIIEYLPVHDGQYEIIGTTIHNDVMPLIRYKVGDIIELDDTKCDCGRNFRKIKKILGRNDDFIVLKDGRRFGRLDHIFKGLDFIKEAQIIQHALDAIEIKIIPDREFSRENERIILERLHKYLGNDDIGYTIKKVENIERNNSGKYRLVTNKIPKIT